MANHLEMSIALTKQSFQIVKKNKRLVTLPLISSFIIVGGFYLLLIPLTRIETTTWKTMHVTGEQYFIAIGSLLVFFFFAHLINIAFNAALTACVIDYINTKHCSISKGIRSTLRCFPSIVYWTIVMTSFGVVVRILEYWLEKWEHYSMSKNLFAGLNWLVATFFVIPVIITENKGPFQAIKRSSHLIREKWGASLGSRVGIGIILFLFRIIALLPLLIGYLLGGKESLVIGATITVAILTIISIVNSTTQISLTGALYLYAANNEKINHFFDSTMLDKAFSRRKHDNKKR